MKIAKIPEFVQRFQKDSKEEMIGYSEIDSTLKFSENVAGG